MKTLRFTLLLVFLVILSTSKAQIQKTESSQKDKERFKEQWMDGMRIDHAYPTNTNEIARTFSGTGCPSSPLTMHAQDTTNYRKGNTTYMVNKATVNCKLPFYIFPDIPGGTTSNPNADIVAPCISFHYYPYTNNLNTNADVTVYQNGKVGFMYCSSGCNSTVNAGGVAAGGVLDDYLYSIDSSKTKTLQFCNIGTVGPTTVSIQNCWDGTVVDTQGPVVWNATSTPGCFTLTVPPTANVGSAFYTTVPSLKTNGSAGITDLHNGKVYIDPSQMPAGTYTVTYHFKGISSCSYVTGTYIFTVPVKPTISITQNNTITCSGSASTFTASGAGVGGTYTWSPVSAATATLSVTNNPTVLTTYTYYVTGTASSGCYTTDSAMVTINPLPTLTLTSSPTTSVCLNSPVTFTAVGANTYTWSSSANGGLGSTSGSTVTATPTTTANATYTVNATDGNGCKNSSNITLNVKPVPTLTLSSSPTSSVCSSSSVTLTATGNSTNYTWTSTAGGGLSSSSGSIVTAMPTISPASYTVVGSNAAGCSSTAQTSSFTIINTPTLNISSYTYTTCLNSPVTFSVSGASSYAWTPTTNMTGSTTATPTVTPSSTATTVYSVTGTAGGCTSAAASVTLTVNPLPTLTVTIPGSYTICNGGTQTLTVNGASTYTWSPAATLNSPNSASPVASPSTTTVYTVIGTNGNGCTNIAKPATATVNVVPPPTLTLTADSYTICQGSSQTFTASGAGNYVWAPPTNLTGDSTATPTANPTVTTTYTLTGTTSGCVSSPPLTVTLTVNPAPTTPTLSNTTLNPLSECQGTNPDTTLVLNAVGATNIPLWYLGSNLVATGLSYAPGTNTSGIFYYTVSDSSKTTGCTSANAGNILTVTVTILAPPAAPTLSNSAFNPLNECQGTNPDTTLVLNAVGATTIPVWYLGSILETKGLSYAPNTNTPGTFYYTVSDSSTVTGCTNIKAGNALTVTVTILAPPGPPTLSNTTLNPLNECQGTNPDTTLVLNAVGATTIPVWYLGSVLETKGLSYAPNTNIPGTFYYTVSDSSTVTGCTNLKAGNALTVTVTILAPPTAPTLTNSTLNPLTECQGTNPDTTLVLTDLGSTITPYWYLGSVLETKGLTYAPSTSTAGIFYYTVSDSSAVTGCTNLKAGNAITVTVTIVAPPGPPTLLSSLSDTLLKECQASPAQTLSVTTTASAIPVWYIGTSTMIATSGYTYTPSTATPTTTIYNIANTSTATGCSSALIGDVLTVTVTINQQPKIDISLATKDSSKCGSPDGGITGLTPSDIKGGLPPYHYQWYNGNSPLLNDTLLNLGGVTNGTYSLHITDANGCTAVGTAGSTSFTVPLIPKPKASFSTNPPAPVAASVPLTVAFDNLSTTTGTGALSYTWTFGNGTGSNQANPPAITYTNVNVYNVMLIAANSACADTAYATITVEVATTIIIPNVFSPNGDGINDQFFIPNTGMSSLNCEIFNRWGQLLYTLNSPNQAWDGKAPDGDRAPDGTYMYILQAQGLNGKTYKQQGTLTLIR